VAGHAIDSNNEAPMERQNSSPGAGTSRRRFLGYTALGAGVAGVLAADRLVAEAWAGPAPNSSALNVRQFGAVGDGNHNDAPAIQHAIDAAGHEGGGVVLVPAGNYRLRSRLRVTREVILQGVGWSIDRATAGGDRRQPGSWLKLDDPGVGAISLTGRGAGVLDLGIRHRQPKPSRGSFAPLDYPFAIDVTADDCWLENVMLLNPTRGIRAHNPNGFIERINRRRIYEQPLLVGIEIDNMGDVMMVDEVHFWPFWFDWTGIGPGVGLAPHALANTTGIRSLRNDNPHFAQIFVFGCAVGAESTSELRSRARGSRCCAARATPRAISLRAPAAQSPSLSGRRLP
jgi:hypothetical protein